MLNTSIQNSTCGGDQFPSGRSRPDESLGSNFVNSCVLGMSFRVFAVGHTMSIFGTLQTLLPPDVVCIICLCVYVFLVTFSKTASP